MNINVSLVNNDLHTTRNFVANFLSVDLVANRGVFCVNSYLIRLTLVHRLSQWFISLISF